jgi:raffinose/stachyose/melibiose transport system substrate-binding protein
MKRSIRFMGSMLSAILIVSALSACGSNGAGQASNVDKAKTTDEKIKLTFRTHFNEQGNTRGEIFKSTLDQYLATHPNVEVDYEAIDANSAKVKTNVEVAGGTTPDIFTVSTDAAIDQYAKTGKLADLSSYVDKDSAWKDSFVSGALYKTGDKYIKIPFEGFAELIWYNKEIFAKNNIKVPETYNEFTDAINKLKAANIVPIAMGDKQPWVAPFFFQMIMDQVAGTDTLLKAAKGEVKFNNPDYVKATETFNGLVESGAFNKGAATTEEAEGDAMFYTEKAAMEITGSWAIGKWMGKDANPGFADKVGAFTLPKMDGGKGADNAYFGGFNGGFVISSSLSGKKLDAAVDLLKYVSGPAYHEQMVVKNGAISPVKLTTIDATKIQKPLLAAQEVMTKAKSVIPVYDSILSQSVANAWTTGVQNLLVGHKDAAAFWDSVDKAYQRASGK